MGNISVCISAFGPECLSSLTVFMTKNESTSIYFTFQYILSYTVFNVWLTLRKTTDMQMVLHYIQVLLKK